MKKIYVILMGALIILMIILLNFQIPLREDPFQDEINLMFNGPSIDIIALNNSQEHSSSDGEKPKEISSSNKESREYIISNPINFSISDMSLKLYAEDHDIFGEDNGESIELIARRPSAKPYIGWYAYDPKSDKIRGVGWMGCHYNLSTGENHQHCSWETLDNNTGLPRINTKFELSYGSDITAENGGAYAQFSGLDKVKLGKKVDLWMNKGNLENLGEFNLYPNNQKTIGFRISNSANSLLLSALGSSNVELQDNLTITDLAGGDGSSFVCVDARGKLFRKETPC